MKDSGVFVATGLTPGMEARLARVARGLTQWQVAVEAGIAPWAVSAFERSDRYVPPAWVRKIKAVLGLNE